MKAVLFDFDGVIIDSEWPIYQSWAKLYKREGHDLAVEDYVQCIGSDFDTWSPEKLLEQLTGKSFDWDVENAARQIEIETDLEDVKPLPGVVELLEQLKARQIPLIVVSSSSHSWVDGWLEKLELMHYFEATVCRGDAPRIKPAPDLYLEAVSRLGIESEYGIVIEDSLNGIKAAKAAGCPGFALPSRLTSVLDFSIADQEFNNFADLSTAVLAQFEQKALESF